ncbi:hypothetical protein NEOLI_001564 [Neolecta irregularis DAH-3]|uniref:Uncharacterized protein n=1 Tax=Neolecta irregularis (strain DAH-3) TaxID=1198029 RepID=A0A1U7LQ93_NEOID|nr:hypothetical protein NEOLI_001564 [Neolecta irregularis DAH-3]|eukprot:OLL24814.1 hypothetical protein NEOLI_001564 [Neolecta irregularis DAH-3]
MHYAFIFLSSLASFTFGKKAPTPAQAQSIESHREEPFPNTFAFSSFSSNKIPRILRTEWRRAVIGNGKEQVTGRQLQHPKGVFEKLSSDDFPYFDDFNAKFRPVPRRGPALLSNKVRPVPRQRPALSSTQPALGTLNTDKTMENRPLQGHRYGLNPSTQPEFKARRVMKKVTNDEFDIPEDSQIETPQMRMGLASKIEGINTNEQKFAAAEKLRRKLPPNKAQKKSPLLKRNDIDEEINFPMYAQIKHPQMRKGLASANTI